MVTFCLILSFVTNFLYFLLNALLRVYGSKNCSVFSFHIAHKTITAAF